MSESINWSAVIHAVKHSLHWSYREIGERVGLSSSEVAKLARGTDYEPRYTPGRKLLELAEKAKSL